MVSILDAVLNIAKFKNNDLDSYSTKYLIRINAAGERLEYYFKDALCGTFELDQKQKEEAYSKEFSYLGSQNNPPDLIIKEGDAFEIKKINGYSQSIALNSSSPKSKLKQSDPRITRECKNIESGKWTEKDIFYVVGYLAKNQIKTLFIVQGNCYSASTDTYNKLSEPLSKKISGLIKDLNLEGANTKELGGIKRVDPLGITSLRIRGMWQIKSPHLVFEDLCDLSNNKQMQVVLLMRKEKYLSFPSTKRKELESSKLIFVRDIKIKDPDNPEQLIDSKIISVVF